MLVDHEISGFIKANYKAKIMKQIPQIYDHQQALLTLSLTIDLTKVFSLQKEIGTYIVANYPTFYQKVKETISQMMSESGLVPPEYGIHLLLALTNCPLPQHNIESVQFISALLQQKEGVLVYLKEAFVLNVSQPQLYLKHFNQIWVAKCKCNIMNKKVMNTQSQTLLGIMQKNGDFKKNNRRVPPICQQCSTPLVFSHQENQIYMNCRKVKLSLHKKVQGLFECGILEIFVEEASISKIDLFSSINCCCYLQCFPTISKLVPFQPIQVKPHYLAYLISVSVVEKGKSLLMRSRNNEFFSEWRKIHMNEKKCQNLMDYDNIVFNYNSLMEAVEKMQFPCLPEATMTLFKISILNSIFNHHNNNHLHLCITVDQQDIAVNAMQLKHLEVKKWPHEYDVGTLVTWLRKCTNQMILVSHPKKKDCQLIEMILNNRLEGTENLGCTFWIVTEHSLKKELKMDHFAVVLDLTFEKNSYICSNIYEDSVDMILGSFMKESFHNVFTVQKSKDPRKRLSLFSEPCGERSLEEIEMEDKVSRQILQRYYIKSRQYKRTSEATMNHLIELGEGFSCMRQLMTIKRWPTKIPHLSILDAVLVIFIDEETSRNKYSASNTLFANEISKLLLNENDCEISFWDYEFSEDGEMREVKNYLPKPIMMRRMLTKINNLLYGDGLVIDG